MMDPGKANHIMALGEKKKNKRQKKEKIWTLGHICDFNLVGILRIFFIPPPSWEDTDSTIKAQKSYITNT